MPRSVLRLTHHSLRAIFCAAAFALLPLHVPAAEPSNIVQPYTLENTEVLSQISPTLKRDYEVYVSLPVDYAKNSKKYPVVYVTDAPYAFPLIRSIAGRVDRHGVGLESFILVGLGYARGDSGVVSRNRDYTPTGRKREGKDGYGESAAYLEHLEKEMLPFVEGHYRIDTKRRIYIGHSYGALLGLRAMTDKPGLFHHYVLGSPSLWFDDEQPFLAFKQYATTHKDLSAKIRFYVGGLEKPTASKPRDEDMVGQLNRYAALMHAQRWRSLDAKTEVLSEEDHATVFPRLVTRGLIWALPINQ